MNRFTFLLLAMILTATGCGGGLTGPDATPQNSTPAPELRTITGRVYTYVLGATPPLASAVIHVRQADGSEMTASSDADGFYRIAVRPGDVTITASKDGYQSKQAQFAVQQDTTLNFSLDSTSS